MKFEWDEAKRRNNIAKHGLDFQQAKNAFLDEKRILEIVPGKSEKEPRYRCIGFDGAAIAAVNFTLRSGTIRLINAGYWRKGKQEYEKQIHQR